MESTELFELLNATYQIGDQGLYLKVWDNDGYSDFNDVNEDVMITGIDRGALEWHTGTDFIYAINSCRIGGHGSRLWVYIEALGLFLDCREYQDDRVNKLKTAFVQNFGADGLTELYKDVELDQPLDGIEWSEDPDNSEFRDDGMQLLEADQALSDLYSVCDTLATNFDTLGVSMDALQDAYVAGFERLP
jgi:hypothetical protein